MQALHKLERKSCLPLLLLLLERIEGGLIYWPNHLDETYYSEFVESKFESEHGLADIEQVSNIYTYTETFTYTSTGINLEIAHSCLGKNQISLLLDTEKFEQ